MAESIKACVQFKNTATLFTYTMEFHACTMLTDLGFFSKLYAVYYALINLTFVLLEIWGESRCKSFQQCQFPTTWNRAGKGV
jgi:hypothetical protein